DRIPLDVHHGRHPTAVSHVHDWLLDWGASDRSTSTVRWARQTGPGAHLCLHVEPRVEPRSAHYDSSNSKAYFGDGEEGIVQLSDSRPRDADGIVGAGRPWQSRRWHRVSARLEASRAAGPEHDDLCGRPSLLRWQAAAFQEGTVLPGDRVWSPGGSDHNHRDALPDAEGQVRDQAGNSALNFPPADQARRFRRPGMFDGEGAGSD